MTFFVCFLLNNNDKNKIWVYIHSALYMYGWAPLGIHFLAIKILILLQQYYIVYSSYTDI